MLITLIIWTLLITALILLIIGLSKRNSIAIIGFIMGFISIIITTIYYYNPYNPQSNRVSTDTIWAPMQMPTDSVNTTVLPDEETTVSTPNVWQGGPPVEIPTVATPELAPAEQYFEADSSATHVFTVQVSAGKDYSGAVKRRTQMINAGYDSFIYLYDGKYHIMCGKFTNYSDAKTYCESIKANTDRDGAYITNAYLPDDAISAFETWYYK